MTASSEALRARETELERQLARMLQMVDRARFAATAGRLESEQRLLGAQPCALVA